jgi:hypothetical protein
MESKIQRQRSGWVEGHGTLNDVCECLHVLSSLIEVAKDEVYDMRTTPLNNSTPLGQI